MTVNPLRMINLAVLLQQQRYIVAISYLFYLHCGLTLSDFLLFQSLFYFTTLIAEIPAGYIGDIFPRKNVLIFSYLLFMVRIIMWIISPNYYTILAGEVLYGLSKAFYRGVSDGYIYDYLKETNSTNLMTNKYGRFNFYMSCGSAISCLIGAWLYQYIGFKVLLSIELFCNTTAVFILLFLPNLAQCKKNISLKMHISRIYRIVKTTIKRPDINFHIFYASILAGITSIYVWNFQPIMKSFAVPVSIFGVVYFINHIIRAICSLNTHKFLKKISLPQTGFITWVLYILCFAILFEIQKHGNITTCIFTFLFICVAIGIQMIFNVGNLSRIHRLISSESRATVSSVNSMFTSLFSGLFLLVFKNISTNFSTEYALLIFTITFMLAIILLRKILQQKI